MQTSRILVAIDIKSEYLFMKYFPFFFSSTTQPAISRGPSDKRRPFTAAEAPRRVTGPFDHLAGRSRGGDGRAPHSASERDEDVSASARKMGRVHHRNAVSHA